MMKLFYDSDTDYLEVFFKRSPNYGEDVDKFTTIFKSEKNDELVGLGLYNPMKNIQRSLHLPPKKKIACLCFLSRKNLGLNEKHMAEFLGLSYRTYQRIEEGKISKIDDLLLIASSLKEVSFSNILLAS